VPASGRWYVVTHIDTTGHAGTHVEAPLHAVEGGADVAGTDVGRYFGEAAILDLSRVPWSAAFDRKALEAAAAPAWWRPRWRHTVSTFRLGSSIAGCRIPALS
jgi:kynurenine formamidase